MSVTISTLNIDSVRHREASVRRILRAARGWESPSDHVPVLAGFYA